MLFRSCSAMLDSVCRLPLSCAIVRPRRNVSEAISGSQSARAVPYANRAQQARLRLSQASAAARRSSEAAIAWSPSPRISVLEPNTPARANECPDVARSRCGTTQATARADLSRCICCRSTVRTPRGLRRTSAGDGCLAGCGIANGVFDPFRLCDTTPPWRRAGPSADVGQSARVR